MAWADGCLTPVRFKLAANSNVVLLTPNDTPVIHLNSISQFSHLNFRSAEDILHPNFDEVLVHASLDANVMATVSIPSTHTHRR